MPVDAALAAALEPVELTKEQIVALLADHPDAAAIRRHLDRLGEVCLSLSHDQYGLGAKFGFASDQLRRTLPAGRTGPRYRSGLIE